MIGDIVFILMMLTGTFFVITAAWGILKFPDLYTRLHASSKATTFGFAFIVLAVAFRVGTQEEILKAVAAVIFQFVTTPIAAHMIARVAVQRGIRPLDQNHQPIEFPEGEFAPEDERERRAQAGASKA